MSCKQPSEENMNVVSNERQFKGHNFMYVCTIQSRTLHGKDGAKTCKNVMLLKCCAAIRINDLGCRHNRYTLVPTRLRQGLFFDYLCVLRTKKIPSD